MIAIINNGAVLAFANTAVLVGNQVDAEGYIIIPPENLRLVP